MSVYFALSYTDDLVKIGYSVNPFRRVSSLRTEHKRPLKLVALFEGDRRVERKFLTRFDKLWAHGEWFFYRGNLKAFIDRQKLPEQTTCGYRRSLRPHVSEAYLAAKAAQDTAYRTLGRRDVPAGRRPK